MNQRRRRQQVRERRQVCLANRRAGTRSPKPLSLREWIFDRDIATWTGSMVVDLAGSPCCWSHLRTTKHLKHHLVDTHGMSRDYTGFLALEAEYMAAVLGV